MPAFAEIDPNRLDEEWVDQPNRYHKYAKKLAVARKRLADAKAALDVAKAVSEKRIRNNPPKYGVTKATDAAVKSAVVLHPKYTRALAEVNQAKYEEDIYEAAVKALEHRKSALQDLVYLWGQSYFAGTMKPRKQTDDSVRERLAGASVKASMTRKRKK